MRRRRWTLALGFAALLGAAAAGWALTMADYTDPQRAEKLMIVKPPENDDERERFTRAWHEERASLRTAKWRLFDGGIGLALLALLGIAGRRLFRTTDPAGIERLAKPRKVTFLVLGWIAVLALPCSNLFDILLDFGRGGFLPWWADSPAIPMMYEAASIPPLIVLLIFLSAFGWLAVLRRARLPIGLWTWDSARPVRSLAWTLILGLPGALMFAGAGALILTGASFTLVPIAAVLGYLLLAARAAMLTHPPREARIRHA